MKTDVVARQRTIEANGRHFAYLEAGEGPLVLLLHGFPDDAWTWSSQISSLCDAGYRVVAPFLRGFPPSEVPSDGSCTTKNNGADAAAILRSLGDGPAYVVGHDWGGLATFVLLAEAPELVRRAAVVAVTHPAMLLPVLERPSLVHHLFHVWFFQVGGLSEGALRANDFALVDYLWEHWAAEGHDDAEHVARLKREVLGKAGVVAALLAYYRALVRLPTEQPELLARLLQPTSVPLLAIWGNCDPAREAAAGEHKFFRGEYRREVLEGAGHFVHREQPARFNELLLSWLRENEQRPAREAPTSNRVDR
jgi:pimeloyl-ACP methyl ester carboxylesterase